MKSYFIFAIVLTVAYIVYYAVIIVHDLYGKKGAGKMQEEVFDLGEPDDEESVAVTENETGFEVGSNAYETETADADRSAVPQAEAANTGISTQEKLERLKAKAEERMEESVPYLSDGRTAEEMYRAMVAGGRMRKRSVSDETIQKVKDMVPQQPLVPQCMEHETGVETPQRTIVRCRRRPGYYAYYALFPVRRWPRAAAWTTVGAQTRWPRCTTSWSR